MAAEQNVITTTQILRAASINMINDFETSLEPLMKLLRIVEPKTIANGSYITLYSIDGTLENGSNIAEGDTIPLSQYKETEVKKIYPVYEKYRKATSDEAIVKSGVEAAVLDTDSKMYGQIYNGIRKSIIDGVKTGTGTGKNGANVKAALANATGKLIAESNAKSYSEGLTLVGFANPLAVYEYLGTVPETLSSEFGFNYVENFLGLPLVILDGTLDEDEVYVTWAENLDAYAVDVSGIGNFADFVMDSTGLIAVAHTYDYDRAAVVTSVRSGLKFYPHFANMIVKAEIAPTV